MNGEINMAGQVTQVIEDSGMESPSRTHFNTLYGELRDIRKKRKAKESMVNKQKDENVVSDIDDDLLTREGRLTNVENVLDEVAELKDLTKALLNRRMDKDSIRTGR